MSSMSGSEIARLVLGYLQSQRLDSIALEFCSVSPYLREEHAILSRGLKIKQASKPRTLLDIIREFIEIEETVNEFFENELEQHEEIPIELLRLRSLKDKVQYACRTFSTAGIDNQSNQGTSASRKRKNVSFVPNDESSDSYTSDRSSPTATNTEDLPGYIRPPKRPKLFDPNLIIKPRCDVPISDDSNEKPKTPYKSSYQNSTSTKHFEMSASKAVKLSESFLSPEFVNEIANSINNAFNNDNVSLDQLQDKSNYILDKIEKNPSFDCIVAEFCSSSVSEENVNELPTDRQLNTPIPNNEQNTSSRYELRSHKKATPVQNTSTEMKQMNSGKAHIISNELIATNTVINHNEPILIESDSEEMVSTTSQQQAQQSFPQFYFYQDSKNQNIVQLFTVPNSRLVSDEQTLPSTSTAPLITNNLMTNVIDPSQFTLQQDQSTMNILGLENYAILNSNQILTTTELNQAAVSNRDDMQNRYIVINNEDVIKEGRIPVQITQELPITTINVEEEKEETVSDDFKKQILSLPQLKSIIDPKSVTPKQLIAIPTTSRSLSTPRYKHVRKIDFDTPKRYCLPEIVEGKHESLANISKMETPHNQSVVTTAPSSAPSKIDSVTRNVKESKETFVPIDEDSANSAKNDTPKVRKRDKKSCVRTISTQKEINPVENEKRLQRVAKTKKILCADDEDSNASDKKETKNDDVEPIKDAAAEWIRIREAKNNPALFEQNLREQNSKKEKIKLKVTGGRKRRRSKKKPTIKESKEKTQTMLDETNKSIDTTLNSTMDQTMDSSLLNLEARMLEENLKSAKKVTPVKQIVIPKSTKKKTPMSKVQIKIMPRKNKSSKRLKNKKELKSTQTTSEVIEDTPNGPEKPPEVQSEDLKSNEPETNKSNKVMPDDLEVAQNLINMKEVILQQETQRKQAQLSEVQSDTVSMLPATDMPSCSSANQLNENEEIDSELLKNGHLVNLSMSSLLETPFKDCSLLFPKTPGFTDCLPQLDTPMLRPIQSLMTDSLFKNPMFPTPSFPITPGSIFTPFKSTISPKNEEVVYGAPNRPTDYSSSSSYYKPDESDGIDKQIQASMQSVKTNSDVYSADDVNDDSRIDDTTQNTLNTSTSSSSSSSSDSDSDSDSNTSSSSDSDESHISQKSPEKEQSIESCAINMEPPTSHQQLTETQSIQIVEQTQPEQIDEDSTQIIKSHLGTAGEINIAQNILLSIPETPIKNDEAIRLAILEEKRRRTLESLREVEMKKFEKFKPKPTKKIRIVTEAKREQIKAPTVTVSPSKRKSSQPKKIISADSRQIHSQMHDASEPKKIPEFELKTQIVATQRLITEGACDNAIADASDVSATQNPQNTPKTEEESVEAIESHLNKNLESVEDIAITSKETISTKKLSTEGLVDMLSEKQRKFDANKPKMKTEVIAALPLSRTTRSRAKNVIRPAQNIIKKAESTTSGQSKSTKLPPESSKPKRKSPRTEKSRKEPTKNDTSKTKPEKDEPTKIETSNLEFSMPEPKPVLKENEIIASSAISHPSKQFETPAKERLKNRIQDLFGDFSDIETPIKSPPRSIIRPEQRQQETELNSNKFEADSSNVVDSDDDESSGEEENYELSYACDENDKKRFLSLRHDASNKSKGAETQITIGTKNVVLDGVKVTLAPTDEMELYKQDVYSVAQMSKERQQRKSNETAKVEATSSSELDYGQPLHTSTPSPSKKILPKFKIKHKSTEKFGSKLDKKKNESEIFHIMDIEDVLGKLHPQTK